MIYIPGVLEFFSVIRKIVNKGPVLELDKQSLEHSSFVLESLCQLSLQIVSSKQDLIEYALCLQILFFLFKHLCGFSWINVLNTQLRPRSCRFYFLSLCSHSLCN